MNLSRWKRWIGPLASRKVRLALATVLASYAAEAGLNWGADRIYAIIGVGVALILGVALEDAGYKVANGNGGKP